MAGRVGITMMPPPVQLAERFNRYAGDIRSSKPVLERIVDELGVPSVRRSFASESEPDGSGWTPLADATIEDRQRKGYGAGPILQRTRTLYRAAIQKSIWQIDGQDGTISINAGRFSSMVPYGMAQHEGSGKIPARPFFGLSDNDIRRAEEMILDWVVSKGLEIL